MSETAQETEAAVVPSEGTAAPEGTELKSATETEAGPESVPEAATSQPTPVEASETVPTTEPVPKPAETNGSTLPNNKDTTEAAPQTTGGDKSTATSNTISADEIALYDRQIRLWGMQAQERMRNANILLITIKGLGNEVAKNLVLAGIGSLTIYDPGLVTVEDLGSQFFVSEQDIGKPRATTAIPHIQNLNRRVQVMPLEVSPLALVETNPGFFSAFTLVIATDLPISTFHSLNAACRISSVPFYAAAAHGLYGFIFADLIQHDFTVTRAVPNKPTQIGTKESVTRTVVAVTPTSETPRDGSARTEIVTKREQYQPFILANSSPLPPGILSNPRRRRNVPGLLPCLRALWDWESSHNGAGPSHTSADLSAFTRLAMAKLTELQLPPDLLRAEMLRSFLQNAYLALAPTCAFLGASLAQDVINVLGRREQPVQNLLLFEGEEGRAEMIALVPIVTTGDASL